MADDCIARVFRTGNSVALRLPKSLGLKEGDDMTIVSHANGTFSMWRQSDAGEVLDGLYGAFSPGFMAGGRDEGEDEDRDWSRPSRGEAA